MKTKTKNNDVTVLILLSLYVILQIISIVFRRRLSQTVIYSDGRIRNIIKERREPLKLIVSYDGGETVSSGLISDIKRCCAAVLSEEGMKDRAEAYLTFMNNEGIRALNKKHRDKDMPTDVLSFPLGENGEFDINPETDRIMLGDIVISEQMARSQAKEYGHSFRREMCFLTVHSMLHLLGYDHETSEEEKIMNEKQKKILTKLKIDR